MDGSVGPVGNPRGCPLLWLTQLFASLCVSSSLVSSYSSDLPTSDDAIMLQAKHSIHPVMLYAAAPSDLFDLLLVYVPTSHPSAQTVPH